MTREIRYQAAKSKTFQVKLTSNGDVGMSDITVIGLGAMGSALAKAQINAGHNVTVWNRTTDKMPPLVALGANGAASFQEAIQASPIILICVDCYATAADQLRSDHVASILSGRIIIQLSTGTPKEARDSEAWLAGHEAGYLDGTILCYPDSVGDPESLILIGGRQRNFTKSEAFLQPLGGDLRYLGENVSAPAALDLAVLTTSVALYAGVAHAAHICETEGVDVDQLASIAVHGEKMRQMAEIIHAGAYKLSSLHDGASLSVWTDVVQRLLSHANESGINSELPNFLSNLYQRGVSAGYGDEDRAALIKVLRQT